ncbi:hypothetical protein ACTQ16_11835 [Prevotella sp. LCP21S3_D2]|uniref:hypothetical protein n=1 Tax=Prevotella sp. LCP21S3_D2 TaxID=3438800 RepID=UPI003F9E2421
MGTVQVMALNPARRGNMGRLNSSQPLTVYDSLTAQSWLKGVIEQIRGEKPVSGVDDGDGTAVKKAREALKKQLPIRAIHYYRFRNNHRSAEDADPESFLFQTTIDVDDMEYVEQALEKARELNCSDGIWKGMLLHLEYSARKKLHIDIRMPMGMTIEETQKAYCEAAGIPYDKSCITPERIIFITDKGSEIYRSKDWYGVLPAEELKARREAFLKRGLTIDGRGTARYSLLAGDCKSPERLVGDFQGQVPNDSNHKVPSSNLKVQSNHKVPSSKFNVQSEDNRLPGTSGDNAVSSGSAIQPAQPGDSNRVDDSHLSPAGDAQNAGRVAATEAGSASEKNLIAFDLFQESAGLKGMNIDTVGSRHSSLLAIMSAGASRVMSEEELMKVVAEKMPSYYQEPDCHQLIHDFYAKYGDSSKPFSRDVIRINATAEQAALGVKSEERRVKNSTAYGNHTVQSSMFQVQSNEVQSTEETEYPAPPPMPKKLPKLVELLISRTPEIYQPAVACAIFPPLATHLWKTRFRYIDNVEHEATLSSVLLAGTGAGKSCVQKPIDFIMEDIRKRDQENLKREKEWKDEMMRKGANKDKRKRPENLIIQEIDADMTNPAFVMRTAEAKEHFLYTSLNEIDQFDALKGIGSQQFRIMCLAFDPDNQYGQTRVGTQSVTERVTIRFNWNASTTIQKGIKYFKRVLTDGPISRINFCTIPERDIGEDIPIYGTYDEEFRNALKPYIDNLCMATGLVECQEAFELAKVLKDENAEFSRLSQDRVYENLSFRANVIGYLKACVLYVANGYKWEPEIADFIRWSERYDLYCKMRFFGDAIKKAMREGDQESKKGPSSILEFLPEKFNYQQVESLRLKNDMNAKGTAKMLRNWIRRGYIEIEESDSVTQKLSDSVYFKTYPKS